MHAKDRDDTRAIAAGLARWYREAMTDCERTAFYDTALADEVRQTGHAVEEPRASRDKREPARRDAVSLTA